MQPQPILQGVTPGIGTATPGVQATRNDVDRRGAISFHRFLLHISFEGHLIHFLLDFR